MASKKETIEKLNKLEQPVLSAYEIIIHIAFNIAIIILIFSLGIGIWTTILKIISSLSHNAGKFHFKELVINVLSLIVVLELIRAFVDYFEHERIRMEVLLEVLLAFVIREFMIHVFEGKIVGTDVFFWSLGIVFVVIGRTLAVIFKPGKKLKESLVKPSKSQK